MTSYLILSELLSSRTIQNTDVLSGAWNWWSNMFFLPLISHTSISSSISCYNCRVAFREAFCIAMHHLNPEGKMKKKKETKTKVQPILSFIHVARRSCEIQFQSCICNFKKKSNHTLFWTKARHNLKLMGNTVYNTDLSRGLAFWTHFLRSQSSVV